MPDAFALFDLPRRPWLDADALKEVFHRRSAALHPDGGGDADRFAELNAAFQILREPAARLRHLLEWEASAALAPAQQIPASLADRFLRVATARQSGESFLAKHRAASSPLARALLAGERAAPLAVLDATLSDLDAAQTAALARLLDLNANWREHLAELAALHAELSYLSKWSAQLRETRLQLDLAR